MALAAVTFAVASTLHFGVGIAGISDPFRNAAIPEAIIAVVVAAGAVCAALGLRRVALGTTAFAILGVAFGLTITLSGGRAGDIAYHLGVGVLLLVIAALLVVRTPSRARDSGPASAG